MSSGVMAGDLSVCTDDELLERVRENERRRNRLAAEDNDLIAEIDRRNLAYAHSCRDSVTLLRDLIRITPHEAKLRVHSARAAGRRRSLVGEPLAPVFPLVAVAQTDGTISARHAALIVQTVEGLPDVVAAEHRADVEATLVEQAAIFDPLALGRLCERVTGLLDPDGKLKDVAYRDRTRDLTVHQRTDGSVRLSGELTAPCGELLLTVLDPLSAPRPAGDGEVDPRSPGQRRHDGLRDALERLVRSETLPDAGGVATTVVVTMSDDAWRTGRGVAVTGHGAVLPARHAIDELAGGDCRLLAVATDSMRAVTAYGRITRGFGRRQRLAFTARDGGCSFPGCTMPPSWCQADHLVEYADGGPTSTGNGHLLCGFHHRHKHELGWRVRMLDGRPAWTPPRHVDPLQRPRYNTAHQPGRGPDGRPPEGCARQ